MEFLPFIGPVFSFISMIILGLIGMIYRDREKVLNEVVSDVKSLLRHMERLQGQAETATRDITAMSGHERRITVLEGGVTSVVSRLDRHGDDIDSVNKRIDFVQSLVNHGDKKSGRGQGDAGAG